MEHTSKMMNNSNMELDLKIQIISSHQSNVEQLAAKKH